jgi:hypothetical protein
MGLLDTDPLNEQQCVGGPVMHPEMEMFGLQLCSSFGAGMTRSYQNISLHPQR